MIGELHSHVCDMQGMSVLETTGFPVTGSPPTYKCIVTCQANPVLVKSGSNVRSVSFQKIFISSYG